jgi:hypothetical protein
MGEYPECGNGRIFSWLRKSLDRRYRKICRRIQGIIVSLFRIKERSVHSHYDYAVNAMLSEFYDLIDLNQKDILERWRKITLLKMESSRRVPINWVAVLSHHRAYRSVHGGSMGNDKGSHLQL